MSRKVRDRCGRIGKFFGTRRREAKMTSTQTISPLGGLVLPALARNWWLILLRGVCAVLFGVLTIAWPGLSLVTLILLFGIYALADGVLALVAAIFGGRPAPRWWLAIVGVIGVLAGLATLEMPGLTALILLYYLAFWAILMGVMEIVGAIRLRKEIDNEWWLILSGVVSVLFGVLLLARPGAGLLGLLLVVGVYAIINGVALIGFAFRLRKVAAKAS
jgi:uncharacterized membrane protein HdeD (DUF308 family)